MFKLILKFIVLDSPALYSFLWIMGIQTARMYAKSTFKNPFLNVRHMPVENVANQRSECGKLTQGQNCRMEGKAAAAKRTKNVVKSDLDLQSVYYSFLPFHLPMNVLLLILCPDFFFS